MTLYSPKVSRTQLAAARTYYVATTGSDSNDGLSSGAPFLTIQKAVNVASMLDNGGYDITIDVENGTYTGQVVLKSFVGSGKIIITGDTTTPANVLVTVAGSSPTIYALGVSGTYELEGLEIRQTGTHSSVYAGSNTYLEIDRCRFGTSGFYCIQAEIGAIVWVTGNCWLSGNCAGFAGGLEHGMVVVVGITLTVSASITVSSQFVGADYLGIIDFRSTTITLSGGVTVTGKRYAGTTNSVILSNGGSSTYFPGTVAGTTATGAQYA